MITDEIIDEVTEQGEELVQEIHIKVDPGQQTDRIDKFISSRLTSKISRTKIQYAAETQSLLVNGKPVKNNYKIKPGDEIHLILPRGSEEYDLSAEDIPLNVVFEDEHVLVINKQAGLVVHPGLGNPRGTLINALMWHYQNLPSAKEAYRPGIVHRLDKDTTGLMIVAKTDQALAHLAKQFFDRTIQRKYIALAWGNPTEDEGVIDVNIGRHERLRMQMQVFPEGDKGKNAITRYKVIERLNYVTLVECKLETGRTHQIRVHMKAIGHTLFGDVRYGGNRILKGTIHAKYKQFIDNCLTLMPRQALHAAVLGFKHPVTGKDYFFESEIPNDFKAVMDKWHRYWSNPNATGEE